MLIVLITQYFPLKTMCREAANLKTVYNRYFTYKNQFFQTNIELDF